MAADVWKDDVWEIQAKSGSSGSCPLFLHFLGKKKLRKIRKMSGRTLWKSHFPIFRLSFSYFLSAVVFYSRIISVQEARRATSIAEATRLGECQMPHLAHLSFQFSLRVLQEMAASPIFLDFSQRTFAKENSADPFCRIFRTQEQIKVLNTLFSGQTSISIIIS